MNKVEFIIVGQGVSGTWLSYYLWKEGHSFIVIDRNDRDASSRLSAGVINPVTGRRHVEVWLAGEIIPFARLAYQELGQQLNCKTISEKTIIDFFPTPQMRQSFLDRVMEGNDHLSELTDLSAFDSFFKFDFGAGEIKPVYTAHLENILPAWRKWLSENDLLREESFTGADLQIIDNKIRYRDIRADKIIFCDGTAGADNRWFSNLPFAPNKGEILIAEIPGLPNNHLYKKGMVMVPLEKEDLWWIGSDYKWEYQDLLPTKAFRDKTESILKQWLKIPYTIVDHLAGVRPATLERRPFVGIHPVQKNIGILNGMGTKGCSLAPFFAKQLCDHLCSGQPLLPEADVNRFQNLLKRKM